MELAGAKLLGRDVASVLALALEQILPMVDRSDRQFPISFYLDDLLMRVPGN